MASLLSAINGRIFGNLEGVNSNKYARVEFYFISMDKPSQPHVVTMHGLRMAAKYNGAIVKRDTVMLVPGTGVHGEAHDKRSPGTWLIRSGMVDQYEAGMALLWNIIDPCKYIFEY